MNNKFNRQGIFWGIIIILLGIVVAINFAVTKSFLSWSIIWPSALIIGGISSIVQQKKNIFGYITTLVGLFFLLDHFFDFNIGWQFIVPAFIIVVGAAILINSISHKSYISGKSSFILFSDRTDNLFTEEYNGQNGICIFGGQTIDLRTHIITKDIRLNLTSVFGGVDVFVPTNVNIVVQTANIFGGSDNHTSNGHNNEFTIFISGTNVFGGVDIKN